MSNRTKCRDCEKAVIGIDRNGDYCFISCSELDEIIWIEDHQTSVLEVLKELEKIDCDTVKSERS